VNGAFAIGQCPLVERISPELHFKKSDKPKQSEYSADSLRNTAAGAVYAPSPMYGNLPIITYPVIGITI
jgi:hypothetical protein